MPIDTHRVVLGFPGSGKTQILIHRADQLSKTYNLSADKYRVFVFTNVIKEYIRSGINFLGLPDESVSTFDHWCRLLYEDQISDRLPRKNRGIDFDKIRSDVLNVLRRKKERVLSASVHSTKKNLAQAASGRVPAFFAGTRSIRIEM